MMPIGYIPFEVGRSSAEANFLKVLLGSQVVVWERSQELDLNHSVALPAIAELQHAVESLLACPWVVTEGPKGFLWAAILRVAGFQGGITLLPYINPTSWYDIAYVATYRRFIRPVDRIFLGSTLSAALYQALGIPASVGEPFGIDCELFRLHSDSVNVLDDLKIPGGRILLFAGRLEPDKQLYTFLRVALKAQLLFPELQIVIATHVVDAKYVELLKRYLHPHYQVHLIIKPSREQLAALYNVADVFVTAATSSYETFGRAPAEAMACGTVAIAPRYDGFCETLNQPGGILVDVRVVENDVVVNEDALLRAIYEVLSAKQYVSPEEISAAAHCRFCRTRTIHLLDYLLQSPSNPASVPSQVPNIKLSLPDDWDIALDEASKLSPASTFKWLWNSDTHRRLASYDREFRRTVRMFLATKLSEAWKSAIFY